MVGNEEKNKEIFPIAIFLDTNILDSLPEDLRSGDLSGLVADAKNIGAKVYIPDVVARELIFHRLDKFSQSLENYEKNRSYIKKYFPMIPEFNIRTEDELINNVYRPIIVCIKKSGCRLLGPPKAKIRSLTNRAVWCDPPFRQTNKGFKDELVILSMLKLARRGRDYKTYVLVTKDKDFSSSELSERFAKFDVNFETVSSLQEAKKLLEVKLDKAWKDYKKDLETEVMTFLSNHWENISQSVINEVKEKGLSRWTIFSYGQKDVPTYSQIRRVVETTPIEIEHIDVGTEDDSTHELPVTIGVKTKLSLEIEENSLLEKVFTERLGPMGWTSISKDSSEMRLRTYDIVRQISLYAVIKRDNTRSLAQLDLVDIRPDYLKSLKEITEKKETEKQSI